MTPDDEDMTMGNAVYLPPSLRARPGLGALKLPALAPSEAGSIAGQTLIFAATEEEFAFVPHLPEGEVDAVVARARAAFEKGPWRRQTAAARATTLRRVAQLIREHADELAALQTLETSIPLRQVRANHVTRTAENFEFFADMLASLAGETYEQTGSHLAIVSREPIGVGLLIAPWNAPLVLSSMKLAAAIALGNSIIVKPSEYAPLSVLRLGALIEEAGVPKDVVQVVCGTGQSVGQRLVRHPDVDVVGFIGGTETGRRIMADASGSLKKLGLELGGKSANIVLATADLERAIDGSLMAIFTGNGEQCLAGSRIMVEESVAGAFIEAFVARAKRLRVGDPFDAATEIGPMAFKAHYDRLLGFAETAKGADYTVLAGGGAAAGFERGYYFSPTVVEASHNGTDLCQREIFGPFVTIQRVRDLDDAIARANASEFGLAGYLWTNDLPSMMRARRELRTGTIWVNTPMVRDLRSPFGGYKQSGIGRDGLPGSIELFTEEKSVLIPQEPLTLPKIGMGD
jgi:5-carboxymethyl-2-hydroxymuconic-semialdehyde dehydrogenase/aminomuconate-semialdehyde/2-hydroxymuconate-6-semialdehyde dehydrogenase